MDVIMFISSPLKSIMKSMFFLVTCLLSHYVINAQQSVRLSFEKARDTISRSGSDLIYPITLRMDSVKINKDSLNLYELTIKCNEEKSTLVKTGYKLNFSEASLDKVKSSYTFFLTLKKDSLPDRDRVLYLHVEITKKGEKANINVSDTNQIFELVALGLESIKSYNYLAYVGTNFDLVDGIKAKNLFFATNMFSAPQRKGFGFSLTLYGNRTLTQTDTSGRVEYTAKIVGLGGDSARYYREEALRTVSRVTDNLGATFSPLFRIGSASSDSRSTQLYYAPQFEFIWRRTSISTLYNDVVLKDTNEIRYNRPINGTIILTPASGTIPVNVYDFYIGGVGFMMNHENSLISIRVQASAGLNFSYTSEAGNRPSLQIFPPFERKFNFLSFVRAWITEPSSGLTFGAEVSNTFGNKDYRPYYNVTLSKAINLKALSSIFQPIASR